MTSPEETQREGVEEFLQKWLPADEAGKLYAVLAQAGVGKTAFLIQVSLAHFIHGVDVLHIALGQSLDQVQQRYEVGRQQLTSGKGAGASGLNRMELFKHCSIQTFPDARLTIPRIQVAYENCRWHLHLKPKVVLVDGYDWKAAEISITALVTALRQWSQGTGVNLWFTASVEREQKPDSRETVPASFDGLNSNTDTVVVLEPLGGRIAIRFHRPFGQGWGKEPTEWILVHPSSLSEEKESIGVNRSPRDYTLLSGGHVGTEEEFGVCAEKWGVNERTFSFASRITARNRGLQLLDDLELSQGDVSWSYLHSHMHRSYPQTDQFKKILQSIWHQVNPASEIFAVGVIQPDNTVKGGTGWAVELAKHLRKPVSVFDQQKIHWFSWQESEGDNRQVGKWLPLEELPIIQGTNFVGTGTRSPNPEGLHAIRQLYERTFGAPTHSQH